MYGANSALLNRLDEEKKELGAQKTKLVRENEVKKARLEDLEKQLDDFVAVCSALCLGRVP